MYRGSRKHILDWVERSEFLAEFRELLGDLPVEFGADSVLMPRGYSAPDEARLDVFGPTWQPENPAWEELATWWLVHRERANTPNWDLLVTCRIEGRPGLVLVEAKANGPELSRAGKPLGGKVSHGSRANHDQIGIAIALATGGWRDLDPRINLSRDCHYQLANRLAFTWKLATLGFPVVLVYLGFTGDQGIRRWFADGKAWTDALDEYLRGVFPSELLGRRHVFHATPCWVLSRHRPVLWQSPSSTS